MLDVVVPGADAALSHAEGDLLARLVRVYAEKRPRNVLRSVYYEGKQPFRDFGIAIPPQIVNQFENVLGWPAKGVNALTDRSVFEGFVSPSGADDPFGVDQIVFENDLRGGVAAGAEVVGDSCVFVLDGDPGRYGCGRAGRAGDGACG